MNKSVCKFNGRRVKHRYLPSVLHDLNYILRIYKKQLLVAVKYLAL